MNQRRLAAVAAALAVWGCLSGLVLIRLWAVLYGRLSGPVILVLAAALAGGALALAWRLGLLRRWLLPFGRSWKTALLAAVGFLLGAGLDTSYDLFYVGEFTVGSFPFRLLCAAGSGLVLAAVVLALTTAARQFGPLRLGQARTMLVLALVVNIIAAWYCAGSAKIYYWDNATYWDLSAMLAQQPLNFDQIHLVLTSVITQEYNYLLAWPISLVMRLLGTGRYVYLLATVNL